MDKKNGSISINCDSVVFQWILDYVFFTDQHQNKSGSKYQGPDLDCQNVV